MSKISNMLLIDEGYREKVYRDTEGYPTIAIGIKVGPKGGSLGVYTFTVPRSVALLWADEHAGKVRAHLEASAALGGVWGALSEPRRDALVNMGYQLGAAGSTAGIWEFRRMLAAVRAQDWPTAYREALDSKWHRQTPERSERVARVLRDGNYASYEGLTGWER